jgi:indole-3-glycerol phosphate synthase
MPIVFGSHPVVISDPGLDRVLMGMLVQECERIKSVSGSLQKQYNLSKLIKQLTAAGAPAISVNSNGVLFGGSMDNITKGMEASNAATVTKSLNASNGN